MKQRTIQWKKPVSILLLVMMLLGQQIIPSASSFAPSVKAEQLSGEEVVEPVDSQAVIEETTSEVLTVEATDVVVDSVDLALDGAEELSKVTAIKEVLNDSKFTLYIDEKTGNVRLVSKETGTEWLGSPQTPSSLPPNNKKFIDSPVHLRYTVGSDVTSTYSLKDATTTTTYTVLDDQVVLDINFVAEGISLQMIYTLSDRGLVVQIPFESIKETGAARLTSLEPLPFMNGALETDEGAMFLPDGSGSLLEFRANHETYLKGYSEYIYGNDATFRSQTNDMLADTYTRTNTPRESIALPVFGMYRNGVGTLAIVSDGQYEAKINGTPAGIRAIPMYRSSVEFMYRKNDVIFIGNSGQIPYFQGQMIAGNRKVEYVLLEAEDANYVGLAKAYRNYLIQDQGLMPVADQKPSLSLELFGGIEREEIIGDTFIKMTTFQQAEQIIADLQQTGVTNIVATYDGWTKGGLYGTQPSHKIAKQLGGKKGLESLVNFTKEANVALYLRANYVKPFESTGKYSERKDGIRGMDRELLELTLYWPSDRWSRGSFSFHLIKPDRVLNEYVKDQVSDYVNYGVDGVQMQYMGEMIYSDEDKDSITDRSVAAQAWIDSLTLMKEQVGSAAVDYGNAYTFGLVDRIDDAPLYASEYTYTDTAVPFYQLVLHGLIPYYASPINLREDAQVEWLKAIEYGALPTAELTGEKSSNLHRTAETRLYSSYAADWINIVADEYKDLEPLYDAIAGEQMINHEQLQDRVFRTTYASGVEVIVNYNSDATTIDGVNVEGMNYTWSKG
ncbi:MAG: DUF5696 domain-containing protein [Candidatus Pristimantibacillus lignocellulolyticus]|uniref:DUF5696 domain-containing protein n=1 Tax=Candidatus Pristimantibacillus lignocellulolyticus TaxID=2994561 RepID=A0A9J6Z954_9BACL|nr:MAG: DUF5696 domain-containing protein [Candidatus Pristimantibacillus lignocellulolyticus]